MHARTIELSYDTFEPIFEEKYAAEHGRAFIFGTTRAAVGHGNASQKPDTFDLDHQRPSTVTLKPNSCGSKKMYTTHDTPLRVSKRRSTTNCVDRRNGPPSERRCRLLGRPNNLSYFRRFSSVRGQTSIADDGNASCAIEN
uniref:Uncharacterized protein n=1 Tax=Romanomermis culicivorax TaxID=13658 RepID=A0A915KB33_ROMCU